jgi:hypothetical protein
MSSTDERAPRRAGRTGTTPRRAKSTMDGLPGRNLPARSKSTAEGAAPRALRGSAGSALKRCNTADGPSGMAGMKRRGKKKGIRVNITIAKREEEEKKEETSGNEEDLKLYDMQVKCSGKFHRPCTWPDVNSFWVEKTVDKDTMCDLLEQYSKENYPERREADNVRPKRCYLQDCKMRGISYYKDYSWDPVELHLRSPPQKSVEILESWTKQIKLEEIPYTPELTNIDQVLIQQGDKTVTSVLKKSKLQGHPLALEMMTSNTQIVTELRGLESVVGVLGNDDDTMIPEFDDQTGDQIWRDVKTLRTLLQDKPTPLKEGKGSQRILEVMAYESFIKARVHYKCYVEGDVVSDHGIGLLLGERWWAHPLKDIMMGFGQENAAMIYEDIELKFYSEVGYKMDNE